LVDDDGNNQDGDDGDDGDDDFGDSLMNPTDVGTWFATIRNTPDLARSRLHQWYGIPPGSDPTWYATRRSMLRGIELWLTTATRMAHPANGPFALLGQELLDQIRIQVLLDTQQGRDGSHQSTSRILANTLEQSDDKLTKSLIKEASTLKASRKKFYDMKTDKTDPKSDGKKPTGSSKNDRRGKK